MLLLFSNLKGFILICGSFPFLMPLFILCSFLIYIFFLILLYISIFITPVRLCHAERVRHEAGEAGTDMSSYHKGVHYVCVTLWIRKRMVEQGDSSDPPIHSLSPSALLMVKSHHLPFVRHTCRAYTHPHTHAHAHTHICINLSTDLF